MLASPRLRAVAVGICLCLAWTGCNRPTDPVPGEKPDATVKPASPNAPEPSPTPPAATPATPPDGTPPATTANPETPPVEPSTTLDVKIIDIDRGAYDALLAQSKGKVLLVDHWATWCAPCVREFPHTVELSKRFPDKSFAVWGLSFDDADSIEAAEGFLEKNHADFPALRAEYADTEEALAKFDVPSLPFYKLYDRTGKLRGTFTGGKEQKQMLDAALRELLAEPEATVEPAAESPEATPAAPEAPAKPEAPATPKSAAADAPETAP